MSIDKEFSAAGSCFLIIYADQAYLITNMHIAHGPGDDPFAIRFSDLEGNSVNFAVDPMIDGIRWLTSDDEDIDLAILPFFMNAEAVCQPQGIPYSMILDTKKINWNVVGAGDICYAVGLFRLMARKTRKFAVRPYRKHWNYGDRRANPNDGLDRSTKNKIYRRPFGANGKSKRSKWCPCIREAKPSGTKDELWRQ